MALTKGDLREISQVLEKQTDRRIGEAVLEIGHRIEELTEYLPSKEEFYEIKVRAKS